MQTIRFRCALNVCLFPVLFGPMAAVYLVLAVPADPATRFWLLCVGGLCLCVALIGIWAAQWQVEITDEGVCVLHPWSGRSAMLLWRQIGAVQRIYAKADFLLLSDVPLSQQEALRIFKRTCSPARAGAKAGCLCLRVASPRHIQEVKRILAEHGLTLPDQAAKGLWQL